MTFMFTFNKFTFDAANQEHRKIYFDYLANGNKWGDTNKFILEQDYSSIPEMIREKIVNYYLEQEFAAVTV